MFVPLLLVATLLAAQQAPDKAGWVIERVDRSHEVPPGFPVEVSNPLGDLRCRPSDTRELLIHATAQHEEETGCHAEIIVDQRDGLVGVSPRFVGCASGELAGRRRVDLVVFVPAGPSVRLEVAGGLLEAKNVSNSLQLVSTTGEIRAVVAGTVRAASEQGSISLKLTAAAWQSPPQVETLTGDISLQLPDGCNAVLEAVSDGHITTDYSITIDPIGPGSRKRGLAKVGTGGATIRLTSGRGNISLLRPRPFR